MAGGLSTLARLGFEEPEAVVADLERLGAWPHAAAPGGRRLLTEVAGSAAPRLVTRALAAIAAAHPDPDGFTARLRRRPGFRRRLVALVAASRSLGGWLAVHPEEADRLADGRRFAAPRPVAELTAEATAVVGRHQEPAAAWDGLRRFKRRELVRVAVRDLAGGVDVQQVGAELADLAQACLEAGLALAAREAGVAAAELAVLGMGKLGGRELNYVSDIDVLFCHRPAGGADPQAAGRAAERVARALVQGLSAVTQEGTCYRMDVNLRPEGRNGPLSRTLPSYQAYWDRWAQPWELQALIKVRPVAGDRELGGRFCAEAATFVYPQRLDPETLAAIRHNKARMEASAPARADGDRQVKLGPGGLRDIEFAVQLLQLVHGRHDPTLRSGSTLVALERLTAAGFVGRADAAQLADAYRFLRTVEHHLQLAQERRTHTIPADPAARRWLAATMGYRDRHRGRPAGGAGGVRGTPPEGSGEPRRGASVDPEGSGEPRRGAPVDRGSPGGKGSKGAARWDGPSAVEAFEADRRRHAAAVRGLHAKLFYRPLLEAFGAVPAGLDPEGAAERLAALGFANPDRAMAHLRALTAGLSRRATVLRAMLPVMLPWLAEAPDPDGGLAALRVLAEHLGDRAALLGMLRDNPATAELLCTVLGASRLLGDLLARHPELLTAMADEGGLAAPRPPRELTAEATAIVGRHQDPAAAWDGLRRFKRRELVRVAVRDLAGRAAVEEVGTELTALAEACLEAGLQVAARTVAADAGRPEGSGEPPGPGDAPEGRAPVDGVEGGLGGLPLRLAVLGMGKLGGGELSYVSDLDVVFCHEPAAGADAEEAGRLALRVVRELLAGLSAVTPEGTCFRVDADLRPEGRNGPLSRTLPSYQAYWDRWAQPWELQALIKARPVAGDRELAGQLRAQAWARTYPPRLDPATAAEVRRIKARVEAERLPAGADPRLHLKLGQGGLADVEWTVQLLQLRLGGTRPGVRLQGTLPALAALQKAGALEPGEADWLADAYRLCLRIRNLAYLVAGRPVDSLPTDARALDRLARAMGEQGRQRLLERYLRATRRARRVVTARFWEDTSR